MNLIPQLEKNLWKFKATMTSWLLKADVEPSFIYASKSRLILSMFYAGTIRKKIVAGCFTTGQEVLDYLRENKAGILFCTIDLEDGDGTGDALIEKAKLLQPSLRSVLIADHNNYNKAAAAYWSSSVIVAAEDIGDESQSWNMAMLAAITNTCYRSKTSPVSQLDPISEKSVKLTEREYEMLECYALGLTNVEAAQRLNLSPNSTKTYSRNLLAKLQVSNRQLALIKALGKGLVSAN